MVTRVTIGPAWLIYDVMISAVIIPFIGFSFLSVYSVHTQAPCIVYYTTQRRGRGIILK